MAPLCLALSSYTMEANCTSGGEVCFLRLPCFHRFFFMSNSCPFRSRPHCVSRGPAHLPRKGHSTPTSFRPMSTVARVVHLSNCWALVSCLIPAHFWLLNAGWYWLMYWVNGRRDVAVAMDKFTQQTRGAFDVCQLLIRACPSTLDNAHPTAANTAGNYCSPYIILSF